ncbi:LPS translocon maturation chaperone LptM [Halioxenophilus aromaticivorans]|uniref:Lipoprotein n=1 Tax=Halioxenophilus aromaticivorans TaxID=1306992 RepID=A0AAV3U586_9ALTE
MVLAAAKRAVRGAKIKAIGCLLAILVAMGLGGCGQTGPLYLPKEQPQSEAAVEQPAQSNSQPQSSNP